jgi:hypothetical protein
MHSITRPSSKPSSDVRLDQSGGRRLTRHAAQRVHLHAQVDTSCKAPKPTPGQTEEQQEAAASGYLLACRAAIAPDAHELGAQAEGDKKAKSDYSIAEGQGWET